MRFEINLFRDSNVKVELDLAHDRRTGLFRVTSPDIPELDLTMKHPGSEESARQIYEAVLGWIAVTP